MLCLFGEADGYHRATSCSESLPCYQGYHVIVAAPLNLQASSAFACPGKARTSHIQAWKPRSPKAKKSKHKNTSARARANDRADSERMQSWNAGSLTGAPKSQLTVQRFFCDELALGNDTVHAAGSMLRCDDRSVLCGQNEREAGSS